RELLPLLSRPRSPPSTIKTTLPRRSLPAHGHIINVTAREGLTELSRSHPIKSGRHVHTNMAKAALQMFTHTEAATMWKEHRVAVNAVEPGWLSAHPEWEKECDALYQKRMKRVGVEDLEGKYAFPLDWEDGVGRVLWVLGRS